MSQIKPFCIQVAPAVAGRATLSGTSRKILSALVTPISANTNPVTIGDTTNQLMDVPLAIPLNAINPFNAGSLMLSDLADHFILTTANGDGVNIMGYELA